MYGGDEKSGLAKIVYKHPEVVDNLQDIIDGMEIVQESDNRIKLESDTHFAVVSKEYKGEPREKWLLTAYEKKETSEPANSRMDVESNLEGKSDDTATRQDSDVSSGKVTNNSANSQKKIHFNQNRRNLVVNDIRGIFPKDNAEWLNWINQGKLLYVDKAKIQALIDKQRTNLADVEYLDLDSVAKILQNFENSSVDEEKNHLTALHSVSRWHRE